MDRHILRIFIFRKQASWFGWTRVSGSKKKSIYDEIMVRRWFDTVKKRFYQSNGTCMCMVFLVIRPFCEKAWYAVLFSMSTFTFINSDLCQLTILCISLGDAHKSVDHFFRYSDLSFPFMVFCRYFFFLNSIERGHCQTPFTALWPPT